jgi:hypothetical protein
MKINIIILVNSLYLGTYNAAPTTDSATDSPMPMTAHIYGELSSKNLERRELEL